MTIERRICCDLAAETRATDGVEERTIEGYAAVFDSATVLWPGMRESIAQSAFDKTLLDDSEDVVGQLNHDPNYVLGRRSAGTLSLFKDNKGLRYRIVINPDDKTAQDIHARIKRGDIKQSSFMFTVRAQRYINHEDGSRTRVLEDVRLRDVSPVTFPAYEDTIAQARTAIEEANRHESGESDSESARIMANARARNTLAALAMKL